MHSELEALLPGLPDKPGGTAAAVARSRRAGVLVIAAIALVDLDQGLDLGIVVAPVGAGPGGGCMAHHNAAVPAEILVEMLDADFVILLAFFIEDLDDGHAAPGEHGVAVSAGVTAAALVAVERREFVRDRE